MTSSDPTLYRQHCSLGRGFTPLDPERQREVVGYVRNCVDGSVEAFAEGTASSVEAFKHDLVTGPQWAVVDQVEELVLEPTGFYSAFRIER